VRNRHNFALEQAELIAVTGRAAPVDTILPETARPGRTAHVRAAWLRCRKDLPLFERDWPAFYSEQEDRAPG
jgi:hypothetical protein